MKKCSALIVTAVFALTTGACDRASSVLAPSGIAVPTDASLAVKPKTIFFNFTKLPTATPQEQRITQATGVNLLVFEVRSTETKTTALSRLSFMITGSLVSGNLTNFQLVYYPGGMSKPGVIVGTNDGSTWVPGSLPANFLAIDLTSPLTLDKRFAGEFVLRADVTGSAPYMFNVRLQTANLIAGGIDQLLLEGTCDLPMSGDTFWVG
jgi:hypothetical protein